MGAVSKPRTGVGETVVPSFKLIKSTQCSVGCNALLR